MGNAEAEGRAGRARGRRPRCQGGSARPRHRPALQSLDGGAQRPDERARRPLRAAPCDHAGAPRRGRSDEVLPAHPDHPVADACGARLGQFREVSRHRSEDHGLPAQQRDVRLRQGGPGEEVGELPRNPRFHVAFREQVREGARQVPRDQGRLSGASAPLRADRMPVRNHIGI